MPRLLFCLCALLLCSPRCLAQAFVERLDPPVLMRGKTTRLMIVGSRLANALDVWSSLAAGKLEAKVVAGGKADRAAFDVRVAADAPVGLFGLRVATADGLSNVHLCLIDDLPVKPVPDSAKVPAKVELPCALWGRFREAEIDRFAIEVKAGQRVSFEVVGSRFGKEVDPLLTIRDAQGRFVAERDNDPGLYFDFRFEHRFAVAGTYTIEVRDSRFQGHEHGSYVLRMGRFPAARVAVPASVRPGKRAKLMLPELKETIEVDIPAGQTMGPMSLTLERPGDEGSAWLPVEVSDLDAVSASSEATTPMKATPAKVPAQLCGVLVKGNERQFFRLTLDKGQAIYATGHGRRLNSSIDLEIALTDEKGQNLRQAGQGEDDRSTFDFTAPKAGDYFLAVRDQAREGGLACAYRVEVRTEPFAPAILAEVEGLTVPRGNYQPVPLVVTRNGYAGPIALTLTGAPPGVTLTPSEIPAEANAIVCKLSAGDSAGIGLHTLQIWAEPSKSKSPVKRLVRTTPMIDRQLLNVDLIPYTLREDQRRLPASVSDRLALQVTEASPFTVELSEAAVTLSRYQQAPIPLITTRKAGFEGPISFTARGGQLADKAEGRTRVYAEFPEATAKTPQVAGSVHSRILTNLGKTRIEVLATATHAGRQITFIRSFELEIKTAFTISTGKEPVKLTPGSTARVRVKVDRLKTFAGPVVVHLSPNDGLECPEKVTVPKGKDGVEVEVKVLPMTSPGRRGISLTATADVDGFEEEARGDRIEIEVPQPAVPKKNLSRKAAEAQRREDKGGEQKQAFFFLFFFASLRLCGRDSSSL
jgi:hypothetical protein